MYNDRTDDPERGIAWARRGLVFGVLTSVAGNVANVCLTDSGVPVALRIPGAVFWPLALFVGIEVMVRNRQRRGFLAYVGRALLMSTSVTTFVTSYVNLHAFLAKTEEPWLATIAGPIGIDGLMLGCTVMLLAATLRAPLAPLTEVAHAEVLTEQLAPEPVSVEQLAPVSAPPAVSTEPPKRERSPRAVSADLEQAVREMLADPERRPATSTERRYARVIRLLKANPQLDVDAGQEKVRPELVEIIRTEMKGLL